jgi:hypothetical protein
VGPAERPANVLLPKTSCEPRLAQVYAELLPLAERASLSLLHDPDPVRHARSIS